jgi:MgtE-like protein
MSAVRDSVAERRKLAHTLGVEPDRLSMLDDIPADDLRTLRQQVGEALFRADRHHFVRIAALSKAVPAAVAAKLTEATLPPLLAARTAELLEPARAVEMVDRLSDRYSADVAAALDASRAADVVAAIPAQKVGRVAEHLARRQDWVVMGGFVTHVNEVALRAAVAKLDGNELLRISFVLEDMSRLDPIGEMLTDTQLDELLAAAAEHELWRELGALIDNLASERVARLAERYEFLEPEGRARYDAAAAAGHLPASALAALQRR